MYNAVLKPILNFHFLNFTETFFSSQHQWPLISIILQVAMAGFEPSSLRFSAKAVTAEAS